jgi:septal ring-binding cell division protein DamX
MGFYSIYKRLKVKGKVMYEPQIQISASSPQKALNEFAKRENLKGADLTATYKVISSSYSEKVFKPKV